MEGMCMRGKGGVQEAWPVGAGVVEGLGGEVFGLKVVGC